MRCYVTSRRSIELIDAIRFPDKAMPCDGVRGGLRSCQVPSCLKPTDSQCSVTNFYQHLAMVCGPRSSSFIMETVLFLQLWPITLVIVSGEVYDITRHLN